MFHPYPYQQECLDALAHARQQHRKQGLVVMASGLGKTVTAAFDVKRWLQNHGGRVLYLCHQNDILEQARNTFEAVIGGSHTFGYFHGREKNLHEVSCLFASFQTMREWRNAFFQNEFDYVVVDESHHGPAPTYRPTVEYFEAKFLLSITATPERTDLQDLQQMYGSEVFSLHLGEALARGLLSPVDYRLMTDELQLQSVLDTPIGKLSITYLNKVIFVPKRDEEIARIIQQRSQEVSNARIMIFCPSIQYCERLAAHLPNAFPIHSDLNPRDQATRLDLFRRGAVTTVLTVDKFNEGIDVPEANIVVFLRSTASRTIFFQQLGRGLRRAEGKEKVLVLDFVANCERLELVNDLWQEVQGKRNQYEKSDAVRPPVNVDVGRIQFTEVAKRALEVITAIRGGHTKEMLIISLQRLAADLGQTPTEREVNEASKAGRCWSTSAFHKYFGSFNNALKAAGLSVGRIVGYTREQLIEQLKDLAVKLGRSPTNADIDEASSKDECASRSPFVIVFGSFSAALKAAELKGTRREFKKHYGTEELIQQLKDLAAELGHTPEEKEVKVASNEGKCPSPMTFIRRFGSFKAAREAAGLIPNPKPPKPQQESTSTHPVVYTKAELIGQLRVLARELGRTPKVKDVDRACRRKKCADSGTFTSHFGSFNAALQTAELPITLSRGYPKEKLIEQLQQVARELGKSPTIHDMDRLSKEKKCASGSTFRDAFGSFNAALEAAGLTVNYQERYSDEELIQGLQSLAQQLGRSPIATEVDAANKEGRCANASTFINRFGSFNEALQTAGLPLTHKMGYSKEEVIQQLKDLAQNLGRLPTKQDVINGSKQKKCASYPVYHQLFGSFEQALVAAGLLARVRGGTREEMIAQLQLLAQKLSRTPRAKDVNAASKRNECVSVHALSEEFGSYNAAIEAAALVINIKGRWTKEELIQQLKDLARELGKPPRKGDIQAASKERRCACYPTFAEMFGSLPAALEAAGIDSNIQFQNNTVH